MIRVLVVDAHSVFRSGVASLIAQQLDMQVVAEAGSLDETILLLPKLRADVLIFDARLALAPGAALENIFELCPRLRVVVLTPEPNEEETIEVLRAGASGVANRLIQPEHLLECIRRVCEGEIWLSSEGIRWLLRAYVQQMHLQPLCPAQFSPRELLVVSGVVRGLRNEQIAEEIGISEQLVRSCLRRVYDRLGVADRSELATYCVRHGLLEQGSPRLRPVAVQ